MSWLGALKGASTRKPAEPKVEPEVSPRTAKRNKLQEERLQRAHQRERLRKQLKAVQEAKEAADLAEAELFALDPDIFEGTLDNIDAPENIEDLEDILNDSEPPIMANFDETNEDNGADAIKNLGQIKVNWDAEKPEYFFQKLETELQIFSINKQFTKRQALIRALPDEVAVEFMHLVTLQETEAGNLAYKNLKTALIKAYGPRPGDAFQRALDRVMVGKPSTLLKLLITDICKQNLTNCCCQTTVWGLFQNKIPLYLKTGLANETFNNANMHDIMDRADNLWAANQVDKQVSALAAQAPTTKTVSTPATADTSTEIAAVNKGRANFRNSRNRGRGNRGGRGRGSQNQAQNQPDPRGKRHESNPPWNSCSAHWVYYDKAFKCQSPMTCPMKDKITPKI